MSVICAQCRTPLSVAPANGICPKCGQAWISGPVLAAESVVPPQARLSKLAVASFVFAFAGCLPVLNAGIALGLGIGALAAISASKGELRGRGLAIAGIVLGVSSVVVVLPMTVVGGAALSRYLQRSRLEEIRSQVHSLGQKEFDYYQVHGQFLRLPPMPLVRPSGPTLLQPTEASRALAWNPPESPRYQFEVEVDGAGPEARARVTADMAALVAMGGQAPHEELLVTPNGVGIVTEVATPLH